MPEARQVCSQYSQGWLWKCRSRLRISSSLHAQSGVTSRALCVGEVFLSASHGAAVMVKAVLAQHTPSTKICMMVAIDRSGAKK